MTTLLGTSPKKFMEKLQLFAVVFVFMKIIHVKLKLYSEYLPDKRRDVCMLEMLG